MPSISHRTHLSRDFPQRAKSGLATPPAGLVRPIARRLARWLGCTPRIWIADLDAHLRRDIGVSPQGLDLKP